MADLSSLPPLYLDAGIAALEMLALVAAYWLARLLVRGVVRVLVARSAGAARAVGTVAGVLLGVIFVLLALLILAGDALLLYHGEGVLEGSLARLRALPPGLGMALAECLVVIAAGALAIPLTRRSLGRLSRLARARIGAAEDDIIAFFGLLTRTAANVIRLLVVLICARLLALSEASFVVLLGLRIYLLVAAGGLVVRGVTAGVDSLDALSARFAGPESRFGVYHDVRGLVPLFRRCLELAIWFAVSSLALLQISAVAPLAAWGPKLIEVVAIVFVARIGTELAGLFVDRSQGEQSGLSTVEKQQRATLMPLIKSLLRLVVYFIALVFILNALDFNPLPLLAGAGVVGIVLGLGAQAVITDVVSGFLILVESQFLVGDYIETGAARGIVEAIQLRTTRIRDPNGQQHILRNGQITAVVNHSKTYTNAVVQLEVPYEADLEQAYALVRSVGTRFAAEHPDILEPTVIEGVEHFSKTSVEIRTTTRVRPGTHGRVARDLRLALFEAFRGAALPVKG